MLNVARTAYSRRLHFVSPFVERELGKQQFSMAANRQHSKCPILHCLSAGDAEKHGPAVAYLATAWHRLPPHVREAIFTLVDGSLAQQELETGRS